VSHDLISGGAELTLHLGIHLDDQAIAESDGSQEPVRDLELDYLTEICERDIIGDKRDVLDRRR
jgi:hypothetical protein